MDKKVRPIIKWTLIIIITSGLFYFLYPAYRFMTISGDVKDELTEIECNGTIRAVREKQPCFSTMTVKQNTDTVNLPVCTCGLTSGFWNYVKTGDKLEKKKGQFTVTVIKQTTGDRKEFEYPYCFH